MKSLFLVFQKAGNLVMNHTSFTTLDSPLTDHSMRDIIFLLAQSGMVITTLVFYGYLINEIRRATGLTSFKPDRKKKIIRNCLIIVTGWLLFVSIWSGSGMMSDFDKFPLNAAPVLLAPLIGSVLLTFSKSFTTILVLIPPDRLIRLQSFRIIVEVILWALFIIDQLPVQMTFEGMNIDILAGLSAPVITYLIMANRISRKWIAAWNILCLGLLFNIVAIGLLSLPTPFQRFHSEPDNIVLTTFPLSWLPGLLVPLAYSLHFFSLRQLSCKPSSGR